MTNPVRIPDPSESKALVHAEVGTNWLMPLLHAATKLEGTVAVVCASSQKAALVDEISALGNVAAQKLQVAVGTSDRDIDRLVIKPPPHILVLPQRCDYKLKERVRALLHTRPQTIWCATDAENERSFRNLFGIRDAAPAPALNG